MSCQLLVGRVLQIGRRGNREPLGQCNEVAACLPVHPFASPLRFVLPAASLLERLPVFRMWLAVIATLSVFLSGPLSAAWAGTPASGGLPPGVVVKLTLVEVNHLPVGIFPIMWRHSQPMCPVRLAVALRFQVAYTKDSHVATLTRSNGEAAVFKVGNPNCVVRTRTGVSRLLHMREAPVILTLPHIDDRMWIPLDTVVTLAGGSMTGQGRRLYIKL